jgi:dimethylaniline monooxygenase (N-oxide forming)
MHTYRITIRIRIKAHNNNKKRVAILGSGPGGLVSAKQALENGIVPVIFEKKSVPGGLWSAGTAIWDGMHTNVSRYSVMFSDFPWPENSSIIPSAKEVYNYLLSYIRHFKLDKYLKLNTFVESVRQLPNKKWQVTYTDFISGERITEVFDYLVCSSGLHCRPSIPKLENSENFKGYILHSTDYRSNDERLKSKRIVVVGNSYSGVEIASHLVGHAKSIVNLFSRPYLVMPRLLKLKAEEENHYHIVPIDLLFGRELTFGATSKEEERLNKIKLYKELCPHQTDMNKSHPSMYYELDNDEPIREAVTDNYYPFIRQGKIIPKRGKVVGFVPEGLLIDDGSILEADAVIFCTGYRLCLDYFDQSVMKTLKFDPEMDRFPILLYKYTVHPDLENLAMVGGVNGLFFAGFELQARWAMKLFKGENKLPSRSEIMKEMREDELKRESMSNNQYPHGIYNEIIDKLAAEVDALPNFEQIKRMNPKLYEMFWKNGTIPSHFCFNENRSLSLQMMNEVDDIINRKYYIPQEQSDHMTTSQLAQMFSRNYKIPLHLFKD